uniref:Diacylglycerol kinase gamma n=1 Tax=Romanomermis culicivorax TaxID=13658 RepID=A0A915JB21_ROMCU
MTEKLVKLLIQVELIAFIPVDLTGLLYFAIRCAHGRTSLNHNSIEALRKYIPNNYLSDAKRRQIWRSIFLKRRKTHFFIDSDSGNKQNIYNSVLCASDKLLKDVIDKFTLKDIADSTENDKCDNEFVRYATFKRFMDVYLDADLPALLCKHLFDSFVEKQSGNVTNVLNLESSDSPASLISQQKFCRKLLLKKTSSSQTLDSPNIAPSLNTVENSAKTKNDSKVPFKDIACYLALLENGKPEQKLEFMFHLYDKDGNGYLDSKEIENIIEQMMSVAVYLNWDTVELKSILQQMLKEIDYDEDGTVSLEEWLRGGLTTIPLLVLLGFDMNVRDDGSHLWRLHHFSRPAYCNLCLKMLVGFAGRQGLCCTLGNYLKKSNAKSKNRSCVRFIVCKYTVHERCVHRAPNNCINTYVKTMKGDPMSHHWVESNRSEKCAKCKRNVHALEGKRCRWCRYTLHSVCVTEWNRECDLGLLRYHILPPSSIFPVILQQRANTPKSSGIFLPRRKKSSISSPLSFQITPKPDTRPLVVFINPKSGGKQGEKVIPPISLCYGPACMHARV